MTRCAVLQHECLERTGNTGARSSKERETQRPKKRGSAPVPWNVTINLTSSTPLYHIKYPTEFLLENPPLANSFWGKLCRFQVIGNWWEMPLQFHSTPTLFWLAWTGALRLTSGTETTIFQLKLNPDLWVTIDMLTTSICLEFELFVPAPNLLWLFLPRHLTNILQMAIFPVIVSPSFIILVSVY